NATTYNDTSIVASGSRYLYRVAARCTVGGSNGSGSRFAMVVLQNFESAPLNGAAVPDTVGLNGWLFNYPSSLGGQILTYSGTAPLNGFRDFRALEFGFVSTASNTSAFVLSPPQFTERLTFGPLTVSRFELVHSYAHGGNADTGYAILTNTARPMNSGFPTPNNWQCMTSVPSGFAYNDSSSFAFSTIWFSNIGIPAVPWNWGNPGGVIGETFSQVDTSPGTLTAGHDFVFVAFCSFPTGGNEDVRIDDLAWIVY
ncbi:MAG TPA: hypothetical protein VEI97_09530, partial [bacterium]|nr:hypothetical protein [bacterium]